MVFRYALNPPQPLGHPRGPSNPRQGPHHARGPMSWRTRGLAILVGLGGALLAPLGVTLAVGLGWGAWHVAHARHSLRSQLLQARWNALTWKLLQTRSSPGTSTRPQPTPTRADAPGTGGAPGAAGRGTAHCGAPTPRPRPLGPATTHSPATSARRRGPQASPIHQPGIPNPARILHCPLCEATMVIRQNSVNHGLFWGCPHWPMCKGTRRPWDQGEADH